MSPLVALQQSALLGPHNNKNKEAAMQNLKFAKIPLDPKNRMIRAGVGKHDGTWFARIDLWCIGFRVSL